MLPGAPQVLLERTACRVARRRGRCVMRTPAPGRGGPWPGGRAGEVPVGHGCLPVPTMRRAAEASGHPGYLPSYRGRGDSARPRAGGCAGVESRPFGPFGGSRKPIAPRCGTRAASAAGSGAGLGWVTGRESGVVPMDIGTAVHSRSSPRPGRVRKSAEPLGMKGVTSLSPRERGDGEADCPKWG